MAGEERVITWIGNGADVLMERALTWARQERATLRAAMGKPSVDDHDIPQDEQLRICVNCLTAITPKRRKRAVSCSRRWPIRSARCMPGLPLALVTNKPTPFVAPLLDALDIAKYFTVVIGGDDVQNKSRIRNRCCWWRKSSLAPAELLFVGDSRNDIQAAKAAGCCSVGLTYGYNYGEPLALSEPDYLFDQFNELLPALGLPHSETQELKHD
nr:HAD hydrolase-like protein [Klebsiella pneumoniae subsp. pneumoniae]